MIVNCGVKSWKWRRSSRGKLHDDDDDDDDEQNSGDFARSGWALRRDQRTNRQRNTLKIRGVFGEAVGAGGDGMRSQRRGP